MAIFPKNDVVVQTLTAQGYTGTYNDLLTKYLREKQYRISASLTDLLAEWDGTLDAVFRPSDVSGLHVWLDAADSTTLTVPNGKVEEWRDKSGNGNKVNQSTEANRPNSGVKYKNGYNTIDFDANTSDYLISSSPWTTPLTQPITVFIVSNTNSLNSTRYVFAGLNAGEAVFFKDSSNKYTMNAGASLADSSAIDTAFHCWTLEFNGASSDLSKDGTSVATGNAGANGLTGMALGSSRLGTLFHDGSIGEVLIYDGALSAGDITSIETYLSDKWGL